MKKISILFFTLLFFTSNILIFENPITAKAETTASKITEELFNFNIKGDNLRYGMSGETIYLLKAFLSSIGYEVQNMDYQFDKQTKTHVKDFQKSHNLKADGIVGKNTFSEINKIINNDGILLPSLSLSFSKKTPKGNWIIINKTNNTLYWMKEDVIIKKYPVATGSNPSYTPEGKFKVVIKAVNPAWGGGGYAKPIVGGKSNNPLGKRWMGIDKNGGGRYGIHGNVNEKSIGTYASHGCIRMHNADVENLYPDVKKNTPVWIGTEEKLNGYGVKIEIQN